MDEPLKTLKDHKHEVCSVAFSPEGSLFASGGGYRDNTVRLWDTRTWRQRHVLRGHKGRVSFLAFHPAGRLVASVGHDKSVKLWDTESGELKRTLTGHKGLISAVSFFPGGTTLATAGHDGNVILWDFETGEPTRTLSDISGRILSLAIAPDGKTLATAGGVERSLATIRLWDTQTCQLQKSLGGHSDWVLWIAFLDQRTLGSGSYGELLLTEFMTGTVLRTIKKTDWSMVSFAFPSDADHLVSGGWMFPRRDDGEVDYRVAIGGFQVWDARNGSLLRTVLAHEREITSIDLSPDGKVLASGGRDGTVKLWDMDKLLASTPTA